MFESQITKRAPSLDIKGFCDTAKRYFFLLLTCLFVSSSALAEQGATIPSQELRREEPPSVGGDEKAPRVFFNSTDEMGWVKQGSRKGQWNLLSNQLYVAITDWLTPYLVVDVWNRFRRMDEVVTGGSYFKFKDRSFLRAEMGWGVGRLDYIYRWQTTLEYERPLFKGLSGNFAGRYLNYPLNDVWIQSPGLRYYYKDHYVGAAFNVSETISRGPAYWATAKAHLALHERVAVDVGTAIGERIYDIQEIRASEQFGYIIFARGDLKITKNISVQAGYAYSMERPSFIKRDLNFGLTLKF